MGIPVKHLAYSVMLVLLCGNAVAGTLNLNRGRWLFVTKAVDGPSTNDFDFLAAVVASTALTEGQPSVLAVTNTNSLVSEIWHKDYVRRYKYSRAIVVGQNITSIPGVYPVTTLNSASAGVEQAKVIAGTVWQSSTQAVVCSASNYTNALVAASLAARLRVPLLFSAASGDLDTVLGQLNVQSALVVGSPVTLPVTVTNHNLPGTAAVINWLRANGHPVNYVAAVNAADRNSSPDGSKMSLASVVLAARRGGVIYPVTNAATYVTATDELKQLYAAVSTNYYPEYLLLGGAPTNIPFGQVTGLADTNTDWNVLMTDTHYANVNTNTFLEIAVGRLVANNFSEGSLIASRISTYDSLKDGNWENRFVEMGYWGLWALAPVLQNSGFIRDDLMGAYRNNSPPIEDGLILHYAHSGWYDLGGAFNVGQVNTLLAPAFILTEGCSTAALDEPGAQITKDLLRQGAVGFMGGTRQLQAAADQICSEVISSITECESLGHGWRRGFQALSLNVLDNDRASGNDIQRYNWILIGDPALVLHVPSLPASRPAGRDISSDGKSVTVRAPEAWVIRPFPEALLDEWHWSNSLHVATGAGVSMMAYWDSPGYNRMLPYYIAKYRTAGYITNITQQAGIPSPLGWTGPFASKVHVDEHSDGTRTYMWRVRLMDFNQENGGFINSVVTNVSYSISLSNANLVSTNLAPVWNADPVIKLNGQYMFPFDGSLGADARDPEGDPLTFVKTGGAAWLSVAVNGALSGQPDAEGVSTATVTVSDGVNPPVPVTLQITVAPAPPQDTTPPSPNPMTWAFAPALGDKGSVLGSYVMVGAANDWHWVTIIRGNTTELAWSNRAGVVWNLIPDYANKKLLTDATCPYPGQTYSITVSGGMVTGFSAGSDVFNRIATSTLRASMTATQAVDQMGVEYYFEETSGNPGGADSGWQGSSIYVNDGLLPGYTYTYTVKARDLSRAQNLTSTSAVLAVIVPPATNLTWDANGTGSSVTDGGGAWLNTSKTWSNGGVNVDWSDNNNALIGSGGAGGIITLGTATVNQLTFTNFTGTYTLTNGTLTVLANLTIANSSGATRLISLIKGTGGVTMNSSGTLTIDGATTNTYSGGTIVNSGRLIIQGAASLGSGALSISKGAVVSLNFTGTCAIGGLTLGGIAQQPGTYGSLSSTATFKSAYFDSNGTMTIADSDGDGMPDYWEIAQGLNPNSEADATIDTDRDGHSNLQECLAGTCPTNILSVLSINNTEIQTGTNVVINWNSASDRKYTLQRKTSLMDAEPWQALITNIAATPPSNVYTDAPAIFTNLFYRVLLE